MYIKTRDYNQADTSGVNARLRSNEFVGPCPCCSGGLGLEGVGALDATAAGKEDIPTPGQFYRIQSGKGGLETTARRAYKTKSDSEQVKRAQEINNHPLNRKFWRSPKNAYEKKFYPDGIISFNPNFICEDGPNIGKKRCFARIWIPPDAEVRTARNQWASGRYQLS